MNAEPKQILSLEDDPSFVELVKVTLESAGLVCLVRRVETRADYVEALRDGDIDLILADHVLPAFDGMTALALAREARPEVPFVFVSGFLGEDLAIEALHSGATDYVLKANLSRLVPAVRRALQESEDRRARLRASAALQDSEDRFRLLVENSTDLVTEVTPDGQVRYASPNHEKLLGYAPKELVGGSLLCIVDPGDAAAVPGRILEGREPVAWRALHKNGTVLWMESSGRTFRANNGEIRGVIVSRDVTERRRMEAEFLRAQRLESIGTLASGIAHDLNNVLTPISMSIQLFRDRLTSTEDQELLKNLEKSARRGADILRQVLTFARGAEGPLEPVEIPRIVKEMTRIISETFPRSVQVESRLPRDLWLVRGNATQIYQVLMNLCVNARDAMPEGGKLSIQAENRELAAGGAPLPFETKPGRHVVLTVRDTGVGITPEVMKRLFDPFFTTKEPGKGTGLGLATVHKIVTGHGGFIRVESRPRLGTAFEVYLPALVESLSRPREEVASPVSSGGGELILLVDDEAAICRFALRVLQRAGYRCLCAGNGQEAMELFHQHRDEIRLVVTDLMMPVMGGDLAIRAMMQVRADLRFIAMSGLLEQEVVAGLPKERIRLLPKPFEGEDILAAVEESIGVHGPQPPVARAEAEPAAASPTPAADGPGRSPPGPSA